MKRIAVFYPVIVVVMLVSATASTQTISELFEQVDSAVVEILTTHNAVQNTGPARWVKTGSLGSGFLISRKGQIVTAAHVVQTAENVTVRFVNGEELPAKILASDPASDVAMIAVESVPDGITPVPLGDSDTAKVGDQVFVIGAPFGISHSLSVGHVSARRTPQKVMSTIMPAELLQTDAAINTGNSGGPMFNMKGEVIGVVSQIISTSGGFEGLGFVVTSNLARQVLIERRSTWSGMEGQVVTGKVARALNVPQPAGVLVQKVASGSPASAFGLLPGSISATLDDVEILLGGDIILEVQGIQVGLPDSASKIRRVFEELQPSEVISLTVLRAGERITLRTAGSLLGQ